MLQVSCGTRSFLFLPSCPVQSPAGDDADDKPNPADKVAALEKKNADLLAEKRALASTLAEHKKARDELETRQREAEEAAATKAGEHQKLFETEREKTKKLEADLSARQKEHDDLLENIKFSRRANALQSAIGILDPKYKLLLEPFFDKIDVDADGNAVESSIQKLKKDFETAYPELIGKDGEGGFPKNKPKGSGGKDDGSDYFKEKITPANLKEKKAQMASAHEKVIEEQKRRRR